MHSCFTSSTTEELTMGKAVVENLGGVEVWGNSMDDTDTKTCTNKTS